jgi:L-asparaginase II
LSGIVAKVLRSQRVESFHVGFAVVVDGDGHQVASFGDAGYPTFVRSAAKPLQAMAVLRSKAIEEYQLSDRELAVICASHNAEAEHIELVQGILHKLGYDESHLDCGSHPPIDKDSANELVRRQEKLSPLHNNCSGKHSGMLAVTRKLGESPADYLNPEHPAQQLIYDIVREYTGEAEIFRGLDGCSAPVYYLSIERLAQAFARIARQDTDESRRIFSVMNSNPYLVAGRKRLDTELMQQFPGTLISKGGGEGVLGIAINTGEEVYGIGLKVLDGNHRAVGPMVLKVLDQLGLMDSQRFERLNWFWQPELKNAADRVYGTYQTEIE